MAGALLLATSLQAQADPKGDKIIREAFQKLGAAPTMKAKLTQAITLPGSPPVKLMFTGEVSARKPNLLRVKLAGTALANRLRERVYAATGKDYISFSSVDNTYRRDPLPAKPSEFLGEWEGEIDAFFGGASTANLGTATWKGTEKVGAVVCEIVEFKLRPRNEAPERTLVYSVGKADRLIYKCLMRFQANGRETIQTNLLSEINLKANLSQKDFLYTPPAGAKEVRPQRRREVIRRKGEQKRLA
jgi:outer membrane lipoprotein-sorting protein